MRFIIFLIVVHVVFIQNSQAEPYRKKTHQISNDELYQRNLILFSHMQRHGSRSPQLYFYRYENFPDVGYNQLTWLGYYNLFQRGVNTREYLVKEGLYSYQTSYQIAEDFYVSPTERSLMSLYAFLLGFYQNLNEYEEIENLIDTNSNITQVGEVIKEKALYLKDHVYDADQLPFINIYTDAQYMRIGYKNFANCKPLKQLNNNAKNDPGTVKFYENQKQQLDDIGFNLADVKDFIHQSGSIETIWSVYDSYLCDLRHEMPNENLTDEVIQILQESKLFYFYGIKFRYEEQRKFNQYKILEKLIYTLEDKMKHPQSEEKYIGFFGHETLIQNFYLLFMDKQKLDQYEHRIPEFGASINWLLFQVQQGNNISYEFEVKLDDDYLDIKGCPGGTCDVWEFIDYTKQLLSGDSFEQFCQGKRNWPVHVPKIKKNDNSR